jgi:pimeloyl-ACP methyl ester carboxylesterase
VKFEKGELLAVVTIDSAGLVSGFRLKPSTEIPWEQPAYADPTLFNEEDITLAGTNKINVEATLSLPKSPPVAAVIFLSGSGPTDKDSTLGPNKPLKDLAWGLASKSIAVLRWSKPTASDGDTSEITLEKEYLPYALSAISHLREKLASSSTPIFVLGHSLGGMVAPIVAAADPSIKGLILMAAGGGKMYDSALRQIQYLSRLETKPQAISQEYINLITKQIALIESSDLNENAPEEDLLFGAPASYWLSVKEYNQVAAAKSLTAPISILQPGRDYQVTIEDDFMKWKEGLGGRENVDMKVYEGLNHLFIAGKGVSTAEDYAVEGHVDEDIIRDIYAWIEEHSQP